MNAVPRETATRLEQLKRIVVEENRHQNLVSASSVASFDERHIADSVQLADYMLPGAILDIGSGGGFPGLVLGVLHGDPVHLVEPRKRRAAFLRSTADALGLSHVTVHEMRVERLALPTMRTITARAVAPLTALFEMATHLADPATRWVLPKGRSARDELEVARRSWQGEFMLHPSRTDPKAHIVVATDIRRIAR